MNKFFVRQLITNSFDFRASLAKDEAAEEQFKRTQADHMKELKKLEAEFLSEREELENKIRQLKKASENLRKKLFESESLIRLLEQNHLQEERKHSFTIQDLKQKFEEERKQMIANMKDLKATVSS